MNKSTVKINQLKLELATVQIIIHNTYLIISYTIKVAMKHILCKPWKPNYLYSINVHVLLYKATCIYNKKKV